RPSSSPACHRTWISEPRLYWLTSNAAWRSTFCDTLETTRAVIITKPTRHDSPTIVSVTGLFKGKVLSRFSIRPCLARPFSRLVGPDRLKQSSPPRGLQQPLILSAARPPSSSP